MREAIREKQGTDVRGLPIQIVVPIDVLDGRLHFKLMVYRNG